MAANSNLEAIRPMAVDSNPDTLERAVVKSSDVDTLANSYGSIQSANDLLCKSKTALSESDQLFGGPVNGRYPCLDVTRIWCICMVCVDHGGTTFGMWNVMYVQAWVLQYLYLICGACYGMTSKPIGGFVARLALYFCVGVGFNFTAWVTLGMNWRTDMWNVVFQFWFIVALVLFVTLLIPLKAHLHGVRERLRNPQDAGDQESHLHPAIGLLLVAAGFVLITIAFHYALIPVLQLVLARPLVTAVNTRLGPAAEFWGLPNTMEDANIFINQFFSYFKLSIDNFYIVLIFPLVSSAVSHVGWLVLFNTYAHKMVMYRGQEARMINAFDYTMIGLVCYYYGLSHRKVIGQYITRYWFAVLFGCALLWPPGTHGRFDEHPPTDLQPRAMDNALEFVCIVMFLTAIERAVDPKIFTEDRLDFLSDWALLCFLVHKAVHLLIPSPLNWAFLLALTAPAYYLRQHLSKASSK